MFNKITERVSKLPSESTCLMPSTTISESSFNFRASQSYSPIGDSQFNVVTSREVSFGAHSNARQVLLMNKDREKRSRIKQIMNSEMRSDVQAQKIRSINEAFDHFSRIIADLDRGKNPITSSNEALRQAQAILEKLLFDSNVIKK